MSLNIIRRINYGYDHLEPVILGLFATNKNFMLIGSHGTGKTRLARTLGAGLGAEGFVFYDATKEDMISIAGIPNPEAIRNGRMTFTPHQRTIWNKSTIVVDEISRANKESQNLWLEILEERTCFGLPLSYRSLIATANPESYAAAFKLDAALLDRFAAVIPVPQHQEGMNPETIGRMVDMAFHPAEELDPLEISRTIKEIQHAHRTFLTDANKARIKQYVSHFIHLLFQEILLPDTVQRYLSVRTYARHLPEAIAAIGAYYDVAGVDQPLPSAAWEAVRYGIVSKLDLNEAAVDEVHRSVVGLLSEERLPADRELRLEIVSLKSFPQRLSFLKDRGAEVLAELKPDELERFVGELLRGASQKGEKEKLVQLSKVLKEVGYTGDILRQVDGDLILTLNKAVNFIVPYLNELPVREGGKTQTAWSNIQRFKGLVREGMLADLKDEDSLKLKQFLIDVYEEDVPVDEKTLIAFFSEITLPETETGARRL